MARFDPEGPAQLVLTASVARRYYLDGKSKIEIADELKLSRFKVARLLDIARSSGLVKIEIGYPGAIDVDLSSQLQDAFGLHPLDRHRTPRTRPPTRCCGSWAARRRT